MNRLFGGANSTLDMDMGLFFLSIAVICPSFKPRRAKSSPPLLFDLGQNLRVFEEEVILPITVKTGIHLKDKGQSHLPPHQP